VATIDTGRKEGGCCAPFSLGAGSPCDTMWPGPRSTSVPSGVFIHPAVCPQKRMGRKLGAVPLLGVAELRPHLTQRRLGRLPLYKVASWSIQPFGHNKHGPKIGWGLCPVFWGAGWIPSNTKSPGPRPTSIPSSILVHPAVWPQRILAENWGLCPIRREGSWVSMWRGLPLYQAAS